VALTLEITKEIPRELIETVTNMDHDAYPPEDQMTWDKAFMIYGLIKDSLILLKEDGELVGYLSIYGIRKDLVPLAIKHQEPIFTAEERKHLLPDIAGTCDGYLHNIIIYPEYRGKGYRRYLYLGLWHWLNRHEGIVRIWADAVSVPGQRALMALGFEPYPELKGLWGGKIENIRSALDRQIQKDGSIMDIAMKD
jgi:ribosomal protein S18 acetylase RimI-like enzyme